jgi:hypothetical protein
MNKCLNCDRNDRQVALIAITYRSEQLHICPQCLPALIHKPAELAEKLPGAETFGKPQHSHG